MKKKRFILTVIKNFVSDVVSADMEINLLILMN